MVKTDITNTSPLSDASNYLNSIFRSAENLKELRGFFQEIEKGATPGEYLEVAGQYKDAYSEALRQTDVEKFKKELLEKATPEILLDCLIEAAFLFEPRVLNTLWKRLFPWG